jgi:predicted amidohydrolase YtcJ
MLIQRAVLLNGRTVDIRVQAQIAQVGERMTPQRGEEVFDAAGGTVLPGLHDHHVHLYSAAAAEGSLHVGPPQVRDRDGLADALAGADAGGDGWIRAVGYHDSVAGPLDRAVLDALAPRVPVRVQHRSGLIWILNSAGLARIGLPGHHDGQLRSADPSWSLPVQRQDAGLTAVSQRLMSYGVTGITDATPDLAADDTVALIELQRRGVIRQNVRLLSPGKRILHDDDLDPDELARWIADRHAAGTPVAVHCVTAAQLVVTIAAWKQAGTRAGDRIEHAAVSPRDVLADLARLGVTVVTQPNFIAERGDQYLADVPAGEHGELWRVASLLSASIPVALSTDMPFGGDDPWAAMRAAVRRTTPSGTALNADECVSPATALTMFLGRPERPAQPRSIEPGQPGELCLLSVPPAVALAELDAETVAATVVGGALGYAAE